MLKVDTVSAAMRYGLKALIRHLMQCINLSRK